MGVGEITGRKHHCAKVQSEEKYGAPGDFLLPQCKKGTRGQGCHDWFHKLFIVLLQQSQAVAEDVNGRPPELSKEGRRRTLNIMHAKVFVNSPKATDEVMTAPG